MPEDVCFRTKPQLAKRMVERALESGIPFAWVAGGEVYGSDRELRLWLERVGVAHVLAIKSNEKLWACMETGPKQVRADRLASQVDETGWKRLNAGNGAKGPQVYDWAAVDMQPLRKSDKGYWLLARRSVSHPEELAYYICYGPAGTTLEELAKVAGAGGPPWNALRRLKDRSAWTSTRCGNGMAGTAILHWRCWPTCIYRWSGNKRWFQDTWEKRGRHRRNERLIPMTIPELRRLLSRLVWTKFIPTILCSPGSGGDDGTEQDPAM